jgi:hypothetical protein
MPSTRAIITTAVVALAAIVVVAFVQRNVMPLPLVGNYLPR